MPEPRNATTVPTTSREESKEGCTFGSKVLSGSERIVHASQCSMITAVTCTDSDDAKSVRKTSIEACSYCGECFEVTQLVEHVLRCKEVSRLKAEELFLKNGSPSSPVIGGLGAADCVEDPSEGDKGLCHNCQHEFSLLEPFNHADECREEQLSASSDEESSLENAEVLVDSSDDEKSVEKFANNDGKDVIGDEGFGSCVSFDREEGKGDGHFSLNDNDTCGDVHEQIPDRIIEADHDVDGGTAFDDVKSDEDRKDHEEGEAHHEVSDVDDESKVTDLRGMIFDGSPHDDERNSDISDASENFEYDEGDVKGYESSSFCSENGSSDNDCFDVVVNSEATVFSEEFERCPNCQEFFPLLYLVDHASNCKSGVSDLNEAIQTATAAGPLSVSPATESSIVSSDCPFCTLTLPDVLMSTHLPKCEGGYFLKSRGEASSTVEESDPTVLPEHLTQMDDQSTNLTNGDYWSVLTLASSTKTTGESTDTEAEYSNSLMSPPYSYYDREEQCLYCMKMFPVSVLAEHACNCTSRHEVRCFHENVLSKGRSRNEYGIAVMRDDIRLAKITTKPRLENANFIFYHEIIPKAAKMKRIPT